MFRILLPSSRSVQQRSPTILQSLRCFHPKHPLYAAGKTALKESPASLPTDNSKETKHVSETLPTEPSSQSRARKKAEPAEDGSVVGRRPRIKKLKDILEEYAVKTTVEPKPSAAKKIRTSKGEGDSAKVVKSRKTGARSAPRKVVERDISASVSADPRANIHSYLEWVYENARREAAVGDRRRMNVISEPLIDDILERLKPSLEKHKGCDIIDINPGAALWSAKLHDHLDPRTHILLESDRAYLPLLEPLIDAPGSKYIFLPKSGVIWGHLEKVLCKEYLPFQKPLDNDDPSLEKPNNSLLVIANLGLYPKRTYRGFPSLAGLVIHQLLAAIHAHSLFQRYGLVRMLLWVHDDETYTLLPKSLGARRKSALEAELTCESISEVASSTAPLKFSRRDHALDLKRFRQVKARMEEMVVTVPPGRESDLMRKFNEGKTGHEDTDYFTASFLKEWEDLEARYEKGEFKESFDVSNLSVNPLTGKDLAGAKEIFTPEFQRLQECRWRYRTDIRKKAKWMDLVFEYSNIMELQKQLFRSKDTIEIESLKEELKRKQKAWRDGLDEVADKQQETVLGAVHNKIASDVDPPILMWDRREVEPLKAHDEEFYPPRPMSLIDIQPKSVWPILRQKYPENYDVLDYIVSQLYIIPLQSMKRGLSALAPGAYEWLVAECPALTDPTKGGNLDLEFMPVRMVSMEMLEQMVEAWVRWPWKPSRIDLMNRLGSSIHDELDDELK